MSAYDPDAPKQTKAIAIGELERFFSEREND